MANIIEAVGIKTDWIHIDGQSKTDTLTQRLKDLQYDIENIDTSQIGSHTPRNYILFRKDTEKTGLLNVHTVSGDFEPGTYTVRYESTFQSNDLDFGLWGR